MSHRICVLLAVVVGLVWTQPTAAQTGDAENGKDLFKVCRPCHQVGPGARNGIGPTLNGIVGSKAGTIAGFTFSEANKEAGPKGLLWTEDNLFRYLENPAAFMQGNKMTYAGTKNDTDRRDVSASLEQQAGQELGRFDPRRAVIVPAPGKCSAASNARLYDTVCPFHVPCARRDPQSRRSSSARPWRPHRLPHDGRR